jgi:hypothetical protein
MMFYIPMFDYMGWSGEKSRGKKQGAASDGLQRFCALFWEGANEGMD